MTTLFTINFGLLLFVTLVFVWVVNDTLEMSECGLRKHRKREPIEKEG